jgi:hypothetical protein
VINNGSGIAMSRGEVARWAVPIKLAKRQLD